GVRRGHGRVPVAGTIAGTGRWLVAPGCRSKEQIAFLEPVSNRQIAAKQRIVVASARLIPGGTSRIRRRESRKAHTPARRRAPQCLRAQTVDLFTPASSA